MRTILCLTAALLLQLEAPAAAFNAASWHRFVGVSRSTPALAVSRGAPAVATTCALGRVQRWSMQASEGQDLYKELKIRLKSSNIWLVGMDGSRKDLVGDFLARKLGYRFIDTNVIIEQLAKVPIGSALPTLGEESFVKVERAVLDQVQAYVRAVISTGSCAPLDIENWAKFRTGIVVFLDAPANVLRSDGLQTPLEREAAALLDLPDKDRLELLVAQRFSMYSQADVVVPVEAGQDAAALAEAVGLALRQHILDNPAPATPTLGEAHIKAVSRELGLTPPPAETEPAATPDQIELLNKMLKAPPPPNDN